MDSLVGLLHRSTEWLLEHRQTHQIGGYLSRTDYVCHIGLESTTVSISSRYRSTTDDNMLPLIGLTWVANHLLNLSCGLADLGCVSAILWAFEDREYIFEILEREYGARLHLGLDSLIAYGSMTNESLNLGLLTLVGRANIMSELIQLRLVLSRLTSVGMMTGKMAIGRQLTGIYSWASGIALDMRTECMCYSRAVLCTPLGAMGCSLLRFMTRLLTNNLQKWKVGKIYYFWQTEIIVFWQLLNGR